MQIECPACGEMVSEGNLMEHVEDFYVMGSPFAGHSSLVKQTGPEYAGSARKPALDEES